MDFQNLFELQGMLFILMIIGYFLRRREIITEKGKSLLTDLVIDFTLPSNIICAFQMEFSAEIFQSCIVIFFVAIGIMAGTFILANIAYPGFDKSHKGVLKYATMCSNAGFLGNPIAEGIFGPVGLMFASIYLIPQRIFMWSAGLACFTDTTDKKELVKKIVTHPCIIAVFIGIVLMLTQIELPGVIDRTLNSLSNANTALSMLLIGAILYGIPFKSLLEKENFYYSFVRLILIPLLVFVICHLIGIPSLETNVSVVLAGMPAASTTAVLASKYGSDEQFATKLVILSTLLSVVTIPVMCILLLTFG